MCIRDSSGGGLSEEKIANQSEIGSSVTKSGYFSWIRAAVEVAENLPTPVVLELIQLARSRTSGEPDSLKADRPFEYMQALSVLCQGYLAVVALEIQRTDADGVTRVNGSNLNADTKNALVDMGWCKDAATLEVRDEILDLEFQGPVSYTHLTLPTIYSV